MPAEGPISNGGGTRIARTVVVGAGSAGLMATLVLAEAGVPVLLLSRSGPRRAASGLDRSGLFSANGGAARLRHFERMMASGHGLAEAGPVRGYVNATAELVEFLARIGVAFGALDDADTEGAATFFSGPRTGQEVLSRLDERVRYFECESATDPRGVALPGERRVVRRDAVTLRDLVKDGAGAVIGVVVEDTKTLDVRAIPADGVCLATGGASSIFGRSTSGASSSGTGSAVALRAGALYANAEFVHFHPLSVAGARRGAWLDPRLLTAGGRLWLRRDRSDAREPNAVPESARDPVLERLGVDVEDAESVSRALFDVASGEHAGEGDSEAFIDLGGVDRELLRGALRGDLELYSALTGEDPALAPLRVWPAAHHCLGGLWVDFELRADGAPNLDSPKNHATNLPGLYAAGEADFRYQGASFSQADAIGASLYGASVAARALIAYRGAALANAAEVPGDVFEAARKRVLEEAATARTREGDGPSPFELEDRLGELSTRGAAGTRSDRTLSELVHRLDELEFDRCRARLFDRGTSLNRTWLASADLRDRILLARTLAVSALHRDESRGTHRKKDRTESDARWLQPTLARALKSGVIEIVASAAQPKASGERAERADAPRTARGSEP